VPKAPSRLTRRAAIVTLAVALPAGVTFVAPADLDHIEG
jgi:hypothetical protein